MGSPQVWVKVFLLLVLAGPCWLSAQPSFRLADPGVLNFPTIAQAQDPANFFLYISNQDTAAYSGGLYVRMQVNGGTPLDFGPYAVQQFAPGDSALLAVSNYNIQTPPFVNGRNGVVIWVVDDNLRPVSDTDSVDVQIVNGPALRIGAFGAPGFPEQAEAGSEHVFQVHIENASAQTYSDTVWLAVRVNGEEQIYHTEGVQTLPGGGGFFFPVQGYPLTMPPYHYGPNEVQFEAWGTGGTVAVGDLKVNLDLLGGVGTVEASEGQFQASPNPTTGVVHLNFKGSGKGEVEVMGSDGRVLHRLPLRSELDLRALGLPQGFYWIGVRLASGDRLTRPVLYWP